MILWYSGCGNSLFVAESQIWYWISCVRCRWMAVPIGTATVQTATAVITAVRIRP